MLCTDALGNGSWENAGVTLSKYLTICVKIVPETEVSVNLPLDIKSGGAEGTNCVPSDS